MWGIISTVFLGLYCLMSYYIGRRGWQAFSKIMSPGYRKTYLGFLGLLVFSFPAAEMLEDILSPTAGLWLTIWGGYSMVAVSYIFLMLLLIDLLRILDKGIGFIPVKIKENQRTAPVLGVAVLLLVVVTLTYGGWNARNPVVTDYEVIVNKKAGNMKELKVAMVSDIHYGEIIDTERLNNMIDIMDELKPDVILLAGDIMEGRIELEELRKMTETFSQMETKYGIFAVPGNHDRLLRDGDKEAVEIFKEAGIKLLMDDHVRVADVVNIVGRNDAGHRNGGSRRELGDLMSEVDKALPVILLDHQPVDLEEARGQGVDLQVAGHTHRGQVFPSHLITSRIYELDWGLLKKGGHHLVVSSGYGTWGPPLRIGNNPEVVCVTMKFQ